MSQFDGLLDIKTNKNSARTSEPKPKPASIQKTQKMQKPTPAPPPEMKTGAERQLAKSRDSGFVQTSVYVKKETHTMVKKALLDDRQNRDFSELVEELILNWAIKNLRP